MAKVALITGITGQDGAYLAEFLLEKGYVVHGVKRRASLFNTDRIDHLYQDPHVDNKNFVLHYGDLTDSTNLIRIIQQVQPNEIYNPKTHRHRLENPGDVPLQIIEVQCGEYVGEDDIVRLEDTYGRVQ